MQDPDYLTVNIILYCEKWKETVHFYKDALALEVVFSSEWFIEFSINDKARLSIADQDRASIKSAGQKGITITLQVRDIYKIWYEFNQKQLDPTPVQLHPWNANVFYLFDPEGHRIEIWQSLSEK